MAKTITLENPITAIRRFFAKRKINKLNKQIDKNQAKIQQLEAKYFNQEASKNTTKQEETVTEKVSRMTEKEVNQKFGNKIIFERCSKTLNGKLYWFAKRGNIDGDKFTAWSELTNWLNPSEKPDSNGKIRVFYNYEKPNSLFISQAKKAGFEVSFN
jgi:hypothetical protein